MLERGVPRRLMKGSWAGAMGDPQFMPSAYLADATTFSGDGTPDIWTNKSDVLASIAHFFTHRGWRAALPWGFFVHVPPGFDFAALTNDFAAWTRAGFSSTALVVMDLFFWFAAWISICFWIAGELVPL